ADSRLPSSMRTRLTSIGLDATAVVVGLALAFYVSSGVSFASGEEQATDPLPDWTKIIEAHQERLTRVESDQGAREVFVGTVGRAAGLQDVAGTLAVQGMPSKLAKELMLPQITTSVQRLVAALVAWHLADRMTQSLAGKAARTDLVVAPAQAAWLMA